MLVDMLNEIIAEEAAKINEQPVVEASLAGVPYCCELRRKGFGKETPVEALLQTTKDLSAADCIAFGDGGNDISMLRWAGFGGV